MKNVMSLVLIVVLIVLIVAAWGPVENPTGMLELDNVNWTGPSLNNLFKRF